MYEREIGVVRCGSSREEAKIRNGVEAVAARCLRAFSTCTTDKVRGEIEVGIGMDALRFADDTVHSNSRQ